jgi:hypothetical protein
VITVSVVSAGYSHTIAAFPGGGGGYVVATKTLGKHVGLLCGCSLVLDYVLTVAISLASGVEYLISVLPEHDSVMRYHLALTVAAVLVLMFLNLRGVKESIKVLMPIFITFITTHAIMILAALVSHGAGAGEAIAGSLEAARSLPLLGAGGLLIILLKAYTVGAGTYTGIEAISNSVPLLKEPRVATARQAMLYMAVSLAFTSGGLLLAYLLYSVTPVPGKPLNAVLFEQVMGSSLLGSAFAFVAVLSGFALLFVAAQAGYVSGPRALASMAVDAWVPRRFRHLSDQLVVSNGIVLIGAGAIVAVLATGGSVHQLIIIYSFSVFVTFVLSQLGMCVLHAREREPGWPGRLAINGAAFLLSALVATAMAVLYWSEGAGAAAGITLALMLICIAVRGYYRRATRLMRRLERVVTQAENEPSRAGPAEKDTNAPTAVVLVRGYNGAGLHTLLKVLTLFPNHFRNFIFLSVGEVDFDRFKGTKEVDALRQSVEAELSRYVELARRWGLHAEHRLALGVDAVDEAVQMCPAIVKDFPRAIFFCGHLVFEQPTFLTRLLHEQTGEEIQRRLMFKGFTVILLPIRAIGTKKSD